MIVTLHEARRMMCPVLAIARSVNPPPACRTTECMAWREAGDGRGYCGVAGAPPEVIVGELVSRTTIDALKRAAR
jgi:hypothetical protein